MSQFLSGRVSCWERNNSPLFRNNRNMLNDLTELHTFAQIVNAGNLSAASRAMGVALSVVSKRLANLERKTGTRFITRSTRQFALTEEGILFHAQVLRILDEIEQAESMLSYRRQEISGLLRITAPGEFGRQRIVPIVAAFQKMHPQLTVHLELTDNVVDLLESGFDLAIRFGQLPDSSLIARQLVPNFRVACAAPSYLKQYGTPTRPSELKQHQCILIGNSRQADWCFEDSQGKSTVVRVARTITTNDGEAAHILALEGAGITVKSIWDVSNNIANGHLQRLFPEHTIPIAPLHAVFPHNRNLAPRVRAFIDYLQNQLQAIAGKQKLFIPPPCA